MSRYNCVPLVAAHTGRELLVLIDDATRPGEQETSSELSAMLKGLGIDFKLNYLNGHMAKAAITTRMSRAASYFF